MSADADGQPRPPTVQVAHQGQSRIYPLQEGNNWIGRPARNDAPPAVPLPDPERFVSRKHARIFVDGAAWTITDNSENGTLLNGKRLRRGQPSRLKDGDVVVIEGRQLTIALRQDGQPPR
jgi:pSer/pThr/pTyr-binding forkhead associated (FHA) protein